MPYASSVKSNLITTTILNSKILLFTSVKTALRASAWQTAGLKRLILANARFKIALLSKCLMKSFCLFSATRDDDVGVPQINENLALGTYFHPTCPRRSGCGLTSRVSKESCQVKIQATGLDFSSFSKATGHIRA